MFTIAAGILLAILIMAFVRMAVRLLPYALIVLAALYVIGLIVAP